MKLVKFDNKIIRITSGDEVFEGIGEHNSPDYNFHEFGRNEESICLSNYMFYKDQIDKIEILDKFSGDYGTLEKFMAEDGMDEIDEVMYSEDDVHINRLLKYLYDHLDSLEYKDELIEYLKVYNKYYDYELVKKIIGE